MNLTIRPIKPRQKKTEKEIEEEQRKQFEVNLENQPQNESA